MLNRGLDKADLLRIVEAVANEKSIDKEIVLESMESAIEKAAFCIALSIDSKTISLSIDFSFATASTILNNSTLSNPLFNIFFLFSLFQKKMG